MDGPRNNANDLERDLESGSVATTDEPRRRQRGWLPLFLFIAYLYFTLNHNDDAVARSQHEVAIRALDYQLSNYSAWLNGTATEFTLLERDVHTERLVSKILPPPYQLDPLFGSYYSNATGLFRGEVRYYNLSSISHDTNVAWRPIADRVMENANLNAIPGRLGSWNWSGANTIRIEVHDRLAIVANVSESIAVFQGKLRLFDPMASDTKLLEFNGIHFTKNGSFYAFAQGEGPPPIDMRHIPSVVPAGAWNATALVSQDEMARRLSRLRTMADRGAALEELSVPRDRLRRHMCPFTFYGQLAPTRVPEGLMLELEQEIFEPSGISTVVPPKMVLKGILISKSCGILYHIDECTGLSTWKYNRNVIEYAGWSSIIHLVMLLLLSRQITTSRTPAGISRLSRWTFLAQALVDTITFVILISLTNTANATASIPLIAPAALAMVLLVYEMKFAVLIHRVQLPEDTALSQAAAAGTPPRLTFIRFMRLLIVYLWNDLRARIWLGVWFFLNADRFVSWSTLSLLAVVVAYSMFWLPQIVRSVQGGRNTDLTAEYLIGTTICRLLLAFYYLGYGENVLEITPRSWIWTFGGWIVSQVFIILLQNLYGPTFFLPARLAAAKVYDYHPPMRLPDPESPDRSLGDCAICMDAITVGPPAGERGDSSSMEATWAGTAEGHSGGILSAVHRNVVGTANLRKRYSLAPCHHLFHTGCLQTWLAIKNICPQCRRPLPPL